VILGGFPEAVLRSTERRRTAWFDTYVTTMVQRDIEEMVQIEAIAAVPRLLGLLAARSASLLNTSDLSRDVGLPYTTLGRYMTLLEAAFLLENLPAWSENRSSRLVKAPKVHLADTGLVAYLLHLRPRAGLPISSLLGPLLESFVLNELRKLASWSEERPQLYHYRTRIGAEVDIVLEGSAGRLVGVEVKCSGSVSAADFKGLSSFAEAVGDRFVSGMLLYTGTEMVPFGHNLWAVPVSALWES
jgi:predicted AAA+ superfamily ATPase